MAAIGAWKYRDTGLRLRLVRSTQAGERCTAGQVDKRSKRLALPRARIVKHQREQIARVERCHE
jgi:hypothetical protein